MGPIAVENIRLGLLEVNFIASKTQTGGHADVYEVIVPEGAKVPGAHYHVDVDEVITGLEGVVTYTIGEEVLEVRPGESAHSPKGIVHHFENRHAGKARFLVTATPAQMGPEYFRDIAAIAKPGAPPDIAKVKEVMGRYGLVPAALPARA